ncbi:MAG TPA: DUF504 domain-containing protein [Thermoplasmatales archaeon]|nr:DUF504 domain-containing protein [Thermoplasmatales archaeon]
MLVEFCNMISDLLNKMKWHHEYEFEKVTIFFVSRGMPNNQDFVTGKEIKNIGEKFLETEKGYIPYHRIIKIEYEGKVIYSREH